MITTINEYKLITLKKINESISNYHRVIPRDFFNESKLLKCMGRLALLIHENKLPEGINIVIEESGEPFDIKQNNLLEFIFISNYKIKINDEYYEFGTTINSKDNYPLVCYIDRTEYTVFDNNGNFEQEFIDVLKNSEYIQESIESNNNFDKIIDLKNLINFSNGIKTLSIDYGDVYINKEEYKIAINLGDSNPFDDNGLIDNIKNHIFDNYSECEKLINIEIDCEWIPGRGEDGWLVYDINKNKFIAAK